MAHVGDDSLSFVTCVSDASLIQGNLLASPCLDPGSPNELIVVKTCRSAADGLNLGFEKARRKWIAFVHQDVFLPRGWDLIVTEQLEKAERMFGPIGVAGVYGVGDVIAADDPTQPLAAERIGHVVDRGRLLRDGPELPAKVATLDELLLIVRGDSGLRFDPALGFHLYGADVCLQAREQGLAVVAIDALCHHNSQGVDAGSSIGSTPGWALSIVASRKCDLPQRHRAHRERKAELADAWFEHWQRSGKVPVQQSIISKIADYRSMHIFGSIRMPAVCWVGEVTQPLAESKILNHGTHRTHGKMRTRKKCKYGTNANAQKGM